MRTHILTALMALIFSACASHHRDVASVNDQTETEQPQHVMVDGIGSRGGRDVR